MLSYYDPVTNSYLVRHNTDINNITSIINGGFDASKVRFHYEWYKHNGRAVYTRPDIPDPLNDNAIYILVPAYTMLEPWDSKSIYYDSFLGTRPMNKLTVEVYHHLRKNNRNYAYSAYEARIPFDSDIVKKEYLITKNDVLRKIKTKEIVLLN